MAFGTICHAGYAVWHSEAVNQPHPPKLRQEWGLSAPLCPSPRPVLLSLWKHEKLSLPFPFHFVTSSCLGGVESGFSLTEEP